MVIGSHPTHQLLMAWHDGEVDAAEASRLAEHTDRCARCRRWLDDMDLVGTAVRGEPVPARYLANRTSWSTLPLSARLVPGFAAAAVVVALVMVVAGGGIDGGRSRGKQRSVASQVALPDDQGGGNTQTTGGGPGAQPAGGLDPGPGPVQPGDGTGEGDGEGGPVAAGGARGPVVLGVVAPGGSDGPGAPMIDAVRRALGAANDDGGVNGRPFELWVGDAADPAVVDVMTDAGVTALVGGYGLSPDLRRAFTDRGVTWFGPTDVVDPAQRVVPLEVPHADAGRMLGRAHFDAGRRDAFVVSGAGSPESAVGAGVSESLTAVGTYTMAPGETCDAALQAATDAAADLVVLALPADDAGTCLGSVDTSGPLDRFAIPSTAADVALDRDLTGLDVTAVLGAPNPKNLTAGVTRFRNATGILAGYRALASFAAAEMAVDAIRDDPQRPYQGFLDGGTFQSDMLTMDPRAVPYNQGAHVAQLGGSPVG